MFTIFHAFLFTFFLLLPLTLLAAAKSEKKENTAIGGVVLLIVGTLVNWLVFYLSLPIIGFSGMAFYHMFWWGLVELIIFGIVLGLCAAGNDDMPSTGSWITTALVVLLLLFGIVTNAGGVWMQHRANFLARQITVTHEPANAYPDTDANHMLLVSEDMATFEASQALASTTQGNLSTYYKLGSGALQSVDHHLYWIYSLAPSGWRTSNRVHGKVPGYVVVDAEDPQIPAELRVDSPNSNTSRYSMRFYPGGRFSHSLSRYLWEHGFSGSKVTDITLEVNDQWQPYFTASLDKLTLNFQHAVPSKMLLINPETGNVKRYALDNIPPWVDRVYSEGTVVPLLNWWGKWGAGSKLAPYKWIFGTNANRYKLADGEPPILVYTKEGHPSWQAILTSYNSDTAASYVALFDARDNKVRLYHVPHLTLASTAAAVITNSKANLKNLMPVHMSLHKIYGALTWVAPLIGSSSNAYQGIALLRADDPNGDSLVLDANKATALTEYRQQLAEGDNNAGPQQNSQIKSTDGVIALLSQTVENNQTVYYFTLAGDPKHVYRAAENGSNLELPFIKVGAHVRVSYTDVGGVTSRDVGSYDDLGLQLR